MTFQFIANLIPWGILGFLVVLIVLLIPYRRSSQFTFQIEIATPRELVWDADDPEGDNPRSRALHAKTISIERDRDFPGIYEEVIDFDGRGTNLITQRIEVVEERRPEYAVWRTLEENGKAWPFGPVHLERMELTETPTGTRVTYSWQGEMRCWWYHLVVQQFVRNYYRRLKRISEADVIEPTAPPTRFSWKTLALSVVALGSFALWLGWIGALVLAAILIVHEFGHWLAFRMSGHPAPRIMLIPFLGGVAVGNHPHKSRFDEAFCALMGPAFSIVPCAVLLAATVALAPPYLTAMHGWFEFTPYLDPPQSYVGVMALLAMAVGALNLLQLIPILPLDGGQVLRATMQSFGAVWARRILLAAAALGVLGSAWIGDYIIAAVAVLGGVGAWHMDTEPSDVRPMGALATSVIGVGYAVTLAVHAGATIFGLWALGILFYLI